MGIGIISTVVYLLNIRSAKPFYILTSFVILFVIVLPLHILLRTSPLLWILDLIIRDLPTVSNTILLQKISFASTFDNLFQWRKGNIQEVFGRFFVFVPNAQSLCQILCNIFVLFIAAKTNNILEFLYWNSRFSCKPPNRICKESFYGYEKSFPHISSSGIYSWTSVSLFLPISRQWCGVGYIFFVGGKDMIHTDSLFTSNSYTIQWFCNHCKICFFRLS